MERRVASAEAELLRTVQRAADDRARTATCAEEAAEARAAAAADFALFQSLTDEREAAAQSRTAELEKYERLTVEEKDRGEELRTWMRSALEGNLALGQRYAKLQAELLVEREEMCSLLEGYIARERALALGRGMSALYARVGNAVAALHRRVSLRVAERHGALVRELRDGGVAVANVVRRVHDAAGKAGVAAAACK